MNNQEKDRIECAIRHIQTAVDVDPWADPGTQYYEFSNPTKINSKRKKGGLSLI